METARNIPVLPFPCLIVFYSTKINIQCPRSYRLMPGNMVCMPSLLSADAGKRRTRVH